MARGRLVETPAGLYVGDSSVFVLFTHLLETQPDAIVVISVEEPEPLLETLANPLKRALQPVGHAFGMKGGRR